MLRFADDLGVNLARGDAGYLALLDAADAYVARTGLDLPAEPAAREMRPDPACVTDPLRALDLAQAGVTAIIWATGFRQDFGWLRVAGPDGAPAAARGVAAVPARPWSAVADARRALVSFIWGCGATPPPCGHIAADRRSRPIVRPAWACADATADGARAAQRPAAPAGPRARPRRPSLLRRRARARPAPAFRAVLDGEIRRSRCRTPPAEDIGFEIGMLAGSVASLAGWARPDLIVLTLSEFAGLAQRIGRASELPLMADADHGYGNALNVRRTVEELEMAGISGLSIEDTELPRAMAPARRRACSASRPGSAK